MKSSLVLSLAAVAALAAPVSHAEQASKWSLRTGPAHLKFNTDAKISVAGTEVPGSSAAFEDLTTLGLQIGYNLTETFKLGVLIGYPPSAEVTGNVPGLGSLSAGEVTFGPLITAVSWTPMLWNNFKPHVGIGVAYTVVLEEKDSAAISNLNIEENFGLALQLGGEYLMNERWGVFVDLHKIYLETSATGNATAFGGAPIEAAGSVDPVVVHAGLNYRF